VNDRAAHFQKKPVIVEAIQFTGHNHREVGRFMGCDCGYRKPVAEDCPYDHSKAGPKCIFIRTLEGDHRADPGDWVIKGIKGELYPCKPDIFEATYEEVELPV
jgi:hypothetical protein